MFGLLAWFAFWGVSKLLHPEIGVRLHKLLKKGKRFSHTVCVAIDASFVDRALGSHPIFEKLDGAINRHMRGKQDAEVMWPQLFARKLVDLLPASYGRHPLDGG